MSVGTYIDTIRRELGDEYKVEEVKFEENTVTFKVTQLSTGYECYGHQLFDGSLNGGEVNYELGAKEAASGLRYHIEEFIAKGKSDASAV
jgi:hypothetical protein